MSIRDKPPFRADHVGSFLRPDALLRKREQLESGAATQENLRELENECIGKLIEFQESMGLESVTDGEFRRGTFHGDFISQLENVEFNPQCRGEIPSFRGG
jgi:5-methyltetrahydropteroyltriglutamate--homocysteine methyltransferase